MFYSLHLGDEQGLAKGYHPWCSVSGVGRSTLGQMWVLSVLDDAWPPCWSVASMVEWHRVAWQVDTYRLRESLSLPNDTGCSIQASLVSASMPIGMSGGHAKR